MNGREHRGLRLWAGRIGFCGAVLAAAAGCARRGPTSRPATLRIVSFSPGITRILWDMGLGGSVVGVTRFCRLPEGQSRPVVGDAMTINAEAILAVRPTVIFAQTGAERFRGVRDIDPSVRVVTMRIETFDDILAAVDRIGHVTGREDLARRARARFEAKVRAVRQAAAGRPRPRVLFVMGTVRPTAAGPGTFLGDMIEAAGGINAGADLPGAGRWRPTHIEAILKAGPDVLVCQVASAERAAEARAYWLGWEDLPAARAGRVYVVDEADWTIPSTRLADRLGELAEMLRGGRGDG